MNQHPLLLRLGASLLVAVLGTWAAAAGAETKAIQGKPIGIGAGEPKPTHLSFEIMKNAKIIKVCTHLIVDKVSPNGLNFFAIQVNYPNKTWAHGGPQINKKGDKLVQYANWGGLVNRGGGSKDYKEADPAKDMVLIECGIGKPNTVPWEWKQNCEYLLTVERGKQVKLPAGESHKVPVPERTMWEWKFTAVPVGKDQGGGPFSSLLYDSADSIKSFCLWNEAGYGSKSEEQHAQWSLPVYWVEGRAKEEAVKKWNRF